MSFIINGKAKEKRISDEVAQRVKSYVAEIGYKPNSLAKSLRSGKSYIIGLLVEDISNPFFAGIARLMEDKINKSGYRILYASTDNDVIKTREILRMMRDRHVDGYIISPPEGIEPEINDLLEDHLPLVVFDRYLPGVDADYVVVDNKSSAYNATLHLLDEGNRKVLFITYHARESQMRDRMEGYTEAMVAHNLKPVIAEIEYGHDQQHIAGSLRELLKKHTDTDAILFATNQIGVSGLQVLQELGKKLPEDLAILSFDDHIVYSLYSPTITAVAQPIDEIAGNVITCILARLNKTQASQKEFHTITLKNELIIRDSTRRNVIPCR